MQGEWVMVVHVVPVILVPRTFIAMVTGRAVEPMRRVETEHVL